MWPPPYHISLNDWTCYILILLTGNTNSVGGWPYCGNLPWHRIAHYSQLNTLPLCCQNFVQGIKYVKNRDIIICAQCTSHPFMPEQLRMMDHICEDFLTDRMGLQCTKSSESMIYTAVKKRYSVLLPNINQRPTLMHQAHFNFNMLP